MTSLLGAPILMHMVHFMPDEHRASQSCQKESEENYEISLPRQNSCVIVTERVPRETAIGGSYRSCNVTVNCYLILNIIQDLCQETHNRKRYLLLEE